MANSTQYAEESENLLPVGQPRARPVKATYLRLRLRVRLWEALAVIVVNGGAWYHLLSLVRTVADLGNWPDAPKNGTRDGLLVLLVIIVGSAVALLTASTLLALSTRIESNHTWKRTWDEIETFFKIFYTCVGAAFTVLLVCIYVEPDETCNNGGVGERMMMMQAIVRVPRTVALPVTADVHFPDAPDRETLQFSLAVDQDSRGLAKLGIAHDPDASFRINYVFGSDLGTAIAVFRPSPSTNTAPVILNATFTTTEMRVAQSELIFIPDPSGDAVRDASLIGGGESIVRVVNRRRGRVCLARFDPGDDIMMARVAFPLGLVLHAARTGSGSGWGILRQGFMARVMNVFSLF